jgi:hypothetical protein
MELLTGARGYLDVDERLRDRLGQELIASSPEPSRVRDFADAHVSINPTALAAIPAARASVPGDARPSTGVRTSFSPASLTAVSESASPRCRYCGVDLPMGRPLRFCPSCGQNLQVKNCPACGAEVEAGWKFCVACGKAVA